VRTRRIAVAAAFVTGAVAPGVACTDSRSTQTPRAIDSAFASAESTYWKGEHDSARATWTELLTSAEARGDTATMGRALSRLANVAWRKSEYPLARQLAERALGLPLQPADEFLPLNALGLIAYNEGRYAEAVPFLERAMRAAKQSHDSVNEAKAIMNRGLVDTELGDLTGARTRFTAARAAARIAGDIRVEGKCLANLAMLDIKAGDPLRAIALLDTARALYRRVSYGAGEANALGQLGVAYASIGEPQRALVTLDSALTESRRQELPQEEASNLQLLAEQYRDAGDFTRALDFLARAQKLNASLGLDDDRATALRDAAEMYLALGQTTPAFRHVREALAVHRHTDSALEQLVDLLLLAQLEELQRRPSAADSALAAARVLADRLGTRDASDRVAVAVAERADRAGNPRVVLVALDPSTTDVSASPATEARALALRARAYRRLDRLDSAATIGARAVRAIERVRGRYASGALRTAFAWENADVYADLVLVLLRLGRVDDAFAVADAARGRALIEHLTEARSAALRSIGAARELVEGEALLRYIDELATRLRAHARGTPNERSGASDGEEESLAGRISRARNDYEALLDRGATRDAAGAALLGGSRVTGRAVRAALRPDEVLLEYFISADRSMVFAATQDSVLALPVSMDREEIGSRVRIARELLGQRDSPPGAAHAVLGALYGALIAPARRAGLLDRNTRLIIVPHGALAYLPFAALRNASDGRYLVEDFTPVYAPSAASFAASRLSPPAASEAHGAAVALAPFPNALPATANEARLAGRGAGDGTVLTGAAASEAALRRALETASLVHVATHAEMNAQNPMFSQIALARGSSGDRADDGRLEVHEVLGMHIRSSLVFLSGCETGLGPSSSTTFRPGEDFTTLAQAFLYAGARGVVATLWRIEDGAGAAFAGRFYDGLRSMSAPDALATAQRALLRDRRYAAPYDWAAYTITGDDASGGKVAGRPLGGPPPSGHSAR
jgi:CHAT domain-containing protein/tetratricopeptide (TPR) repeat protein